MKSVLDLKQFETPNEIPNNAWSYILFSIRYTKTLWRYLLVTFSVLVAAVFNLAFSFVIKDVVSLTEQAGTQSTMDRLLPIIWLVTVLQIGQVVAHYSETHFFVRAISDYEVVSKRMLFRYLQKQSHDFFVRHVAGDLAHKLVEIPLSVIAVLDELIFRILVSVITIFFSFIFLMFVAPLPAFITLLWGLLFLYCCLKMGQNCGRLSAQRHEKRARVSGVIVDNIINNPIVRMFGRTRHEHAFLDNHLSREHTAYVKLFCYQRFMYFIQDMLLTLYCLGFLFLIIAQYRNGLLSFPDFAFTLTLIIFVINAGRDFAYTVRMAAGHYGDVNNGLKAISQKIEMPDHQEAKDLSVSEGTLAFKNICFAYTADKPVFEDLNLSIAAGEKVGLIGPSGAGKTTLINLLMRFYDLNDGEINIDGQNISRLTKSSLQKHISVIPQETSLFHRSLMENIRYGSLTASDEDVIEAAKKAFAHEFIQRLPQGYSTLVGERGIRLSGGQRQRIAIARAILKRAPILILDEATSALDSESEKYIQESLKDLMQEKTVIAIAHRLSTISRLDRLVVMDQGQIVEDGTHDELLAQGKLYARLWHMQSRGFLGEE